MKRAAPANAPNAPASLVPGAVFWQRLRLEEELPSGPDHPLWLAHDLRTDAQSVVEFLPLQPNGQPPAWLSSTSGLIPPPHPTLLGFYRFEIDRDFLGAISAFDLRLKQPPLSRSLVSTEDPLQALRWIEDLAHALDELHGAEMRPHGALVPSRLFLSVNESPLLTGYPHGAYPLGKDDSAFLPPDRRPGNTPTRADDVFSLSVLAFHLFTQGAMPEETGTADKPGRSIDGIRAERNLAPTGWATGWDKPLFDVIDSAPDSRPTNVRAWFDELSRAMGRDRLRPPLRLTEMPPAKPGARPRRAPPWRKDRQIPSYSPATAPAGDPAPLRTLARIREETEELARQSEELRQRKRELEVQTAQFAAAKVEHLAVETKLAQQRGEAQQKQLELESKAKALAATENRLETLKRQLDQSSAQTAKTQDAARSDTAALARAREEAQAEGEANRLAKLQLAKERERLEKLQSELSARAKELDTLSRTAGDLQREFTAITGSSNPAQWRTFLQRIETQKMDNDRRAAGLEVERKRLEEIRLQLGRGTAESAPADLTAVGEPVVFDNATPPPPPPTSVEVPETEKDPAGPAATNDPSPPAPPIVQENRKATIQTLTGRRIHVFGTSNLRFGRHSNSDVLLVAMISGQAQPTMALNREISRKHFELQIAADGVKVIDGWSDDGKASQHGLCVDGRRVQAGGAVLKNGMLLSVTTRAPGRSVPHWKVKLFFHGDGQPDAPLSALWLQRLDDAPEDVAVVLDSATLQDLDISDAPAHSAIVAQPNGLFFRIGDELTPFTQDSSPIPGLTVLSVGWCSPTIVVPSS